jgi:hypothetical protein
MTTLWLALAGGAAAFAHCLGMCGGFALHLAEGRTRTAVLVQQLLWHAGRIATYVFLGALAGFAGGWIAAALPQVQNVLAYVAGGVMVLAGLALLGLVPWRGRRGGAADDGGRGGLLALLFQQLVGRPTPAAALVLGLATGFLPCPIVLGFVMLAAYGGSVLGGMAVMAAMGLGTVWSLLVLGMTGAMVRLRLRRWAAPAAAMVLVLVGLATVLRGTETFHRLLGCPPSPTRGEAAAPACHHQTP